MKIWRSLTKNKDENLFRCFRNWNIHNDTFLGESIMDDESLPPQQKKLVTEHQPLDISLESPALQRLIEEVRSTEPDVSRSYNRTYNRHNR